MFNSTHFYPSPDMLLCLIFLPSAVNTHDVCTSYLCTSFCTIDISCSEQNIPHSHDLATKLSWPEISREVATAFPFGKIKNCIILFLTLLFKDLRCCITFLSLCVCVRACVRASALWDYVWLCVCGNGYTVIYYTFCVYFCLNTVR
jgi:hypothetical protein